MVLFLCALFGATVAAIATLTGSLATTGLIVLGWLAAGLLLSLLMARSHSGPPGPPQSKL